MSATDPGVVDLPEPTPAEARAEMFGIPPRGYTPVRHSLVQLHDGDGTPGSRASTVARLLRQRKHRALVLYLLLLAAWVRLENRDEPYGSHAWIRALTSTRRGALTWSPSTLSRTWRDLKAAGLVESTRQDRLVRVVPRREDGKAEYTTPRGSGVDDRYFVLPNAFWDEEWFARLPLPALAVLLVLARETNGKNEVHLTHKQFEEWFGVHHKTAGVGLRQLVDVGLLHERTEVVKAPLSKTGWTTHTWYSLHGDFGHDARQAMRDRARGAVERRRPPAQTKPKKQTTARKKLKKLKEVDR